MSVVPKITREEQEAVTDSWNNEMAKDLKGSGAKFFIHLFTRYPDFQKLFRSFAKVPLAELENNKRFQAHGFTVFNAIDGMIQNLDDPEVLDELLMKTGENHGRRKLKAADFEIVKAVLLDFFKLILGKSYTPVAARGWEKVLTYVTDRINEGIAANDS